MILSLEIIESNEGIKQFVSSWESFENAHQSLFYQRALYYLMYCEYLMPSAVSPHLLVFFDKEEVAGIFPWVKQRHDRFGIPYYHIGSIQHDHVNLSDVIYDKQYRAPITELFDVFLKTLPFNSAVVMRDVRDDSQFIELLPRLSSKIFEAKSGSSFYIDFDKDIDNYLPKRMVKNVKRLLRKANDSGVVEFKFLSGDEITAQAFEDFLLVESSGWKGQEGTETAIRLNTQLKSYYQSFLQLMPSRMQLNMFYLNGAPIAAHYCFKDEACFSLAKVGYFEEHKALSPSHVLIYQAIHNASHKGGKNRISFVTGASWLGQWYPKSASLFTIYVSPSFVSSTVLTIIQWLKKLRKK